TYTQPPPNEDPGPSQHGYRQDSSQSTAEGQSKPPVYSRFFAAWSRIIDRLATKLGRGRRRREIAILLWTLSTVVAIYLAAAVIKDDWFALILVVIGVIMWRRNKVKRQRREAYRRSTQEAAARARAEREATKKQRADRAAEAERKRKEREADARGKAAGAAEAKRAWDERRAREAEERENSDRAQAENEAREEKAQEASAQSAAQSGDLDYILGLSPTQFEYTMAAMLRMLGMTDVIRVGGRGDLGVDITARDPSGRTMVVQCKRYARNKKIGSPDIQTFIGMAHVHHQADLKLFVTTSEYTVDARALANTHGIQLMDGSDIEKLAYQQRGRTS
ncbi:MAG: restriction endonuclease, partial [Acidimicrobiales bacterium]